MKLTGGSRVGDRVRVLGSVQAPDGLLPQPEGFISIREGSFRAVNIQGVGTVWFHVSELELIDGPSRTVASGPGAPTQGAPAGPQGVDANGAPVDVVAQEGVLDASAREAGVGVVGWKDTNPKFAFGDKKVPFSAVSAPVVAELGLAMLEGALKYGRHNYRVSGVRASTYYDAALRHLTAWWEGENTDPDSGLPHVVKAIACLVVLRDAQINEKLNDDRPPPVRADWQKFLNDQAERIKERYPNPKPPHTKPQP